MKKAAQWTAFFFNLAERGGVDTTTLKSLNAEIKQLEAQKKLVEKRDGEVPKALAVLQRYAKVLTPAQRRQAAKIVRETVEAPSGRTAATPKGPLKGRKLGSVAPKYRLPTGETWTGHGLSPKIFTAWAKSAEGRSWAKAHPDAKFPPAQGSAKSASKPAKKTIKAPKKVVKKPAKKAAKKA
ncbi:MAG: H-NS family nucleoid-associated regulatory protein [Stenotrophomonas sp.]